jgi:trans-aconitate methyltransferase
MSLRSGIVAQFRNPSGPLGHVVGWIMQNRGSNRERSLWTVGLLAIQPDDVVLELGCGPGVALEACAARLRTGKATGLDQSAVMIGQARKRNQAAIAAGRVALLQSDLAEVGRLEPGFTKLLSVNVVQFVPDKPQLFRALFDALAPGGVVATTYQPRHKNPTRADVLAMAEEITRAMTAAGFARLRTEELALKPVPAICVLGEKPR